MQFCFSTNVSELKNTSKIKWLTLYTMVSGFHPKATIQERLQSFHKNRFVEQLLFSCSKEMVSEFLFQIVVLFRNNVLMTFCFCIYFPCILTIIILKIYLVMQRHIHTLQCTYICINKSLGNTGQLFSDHQVQLFYKCYLFKCHHI